MSENLYQHPVKTAFNTADIQAWLIDNISHILGLNPEEIDIREPLDSYGLDSSQAIILASKAEKFLGFKLSLIHLWYYPTIEELAQRLAEELENSDSEILQI
ncbi:MAG: phosphopantetheine-binding protein [Sphaerospermopsis kisseleviana]|jgi:acyl carrier protein|uniref:Phosphopantetheine-binding protein n=2 Tax=Sphaerospermopsis TaxID=752201 RepID=A0A479ZSS9_9CYAN|nr:MULTISPECIES: acyl carrier protein [Sphaerospermopsis]BAZ79176.1 phosphopantetheine-binding protein [Sphaerospermopsis kisseleviana NIES-73]MBD2132000.1 acyl carrier protein [Sphaerospermopsis sp. FACHB-1094]MBD2145425.1 acyl carrier protein [Sphaerospermopsis sp. FACHB-1194]MDB9442561.1 acyl carrier protein [Sphaerospermopsis kisseleviana CS-549]GCL35565.1 phosphopantetheine-binding protein [Sphaerospermopsis reniformis]